MRARETVPASLPTLTEEGRRVMFEGLMRTWRRIQRAPTPGWRRRYEAWLRERTDLYERATGRVVYQCQRCERPYRTPSGMVTNPFGVGYICRPTCGLWPVVYRGRSA
jgi:hypothetical protein